MNINDRKRIIKTAKRWGLSGYRVLSSVPGCAINGVGPVWADRYHIPISELLNQRYSWAVPACCIHDARYFIGGSEDERLNADKELLENLRGSIGNTLSFWQTPLQWLKARAVAKAMYAACRVGGKKSWTDKGAE